MSLTENITSVKDENESVSTDRKIFSIKVVSKSNRYSHAFVTNFTFIIFSSDMYNLLR